MKKIVAIVLLTTVVLSLTGCCCVLPFKQTNDKKVIVTDPPFDAIPETEATENAYTEPEDSWITPTEEVWEEETEAPTQPSVIEEYVELSENGIQKRINTFLSNFAEAYMFEYPCDEYEMLQFAYIHAMLNNDGGIYQGSQRAYMLGTDVNSILYKYFGQTLPHPNFSVRYYENYDENSRNYVDYDGENYYFENGAGESYSIVAIASKMVNHGNSYTVEYSVFMHDAIDADMKPYYEMSYDQAMRDPSLTLLYSGTAEVKDYQRGDGKWSYHLIELDANR